MTDWIDEPTVSGLLVFTHPEQLAAARASVDCFFAQDWPHKELVVYNSTKHTLKSCWSFRRKIVELRLRARSPAGMLDLCLENASGEWCLNWLADCLYDPAYIRTHMHYRNRQRLVLLNRKQVYSISDQRMAVVTGTAIPCWSFYRHHAVRFDTDLQPQFAETMALEHNKAELITKFACALV